MPTSILFVRNIREPFDLYALRTQIEERHRQIKNFWYINKFTSPNKSLIEAHVLFTLLTYSLIQLYLNKNHLNAIANKTIQSFLDEIDCLKRIYRNLDSRVKKRNGELKIYSGTFVLLNIEPESKMETLYEIVCKKAKKTR